ncbi:MAG: four helix bundle protein [Bacteroidetes bacterium]|nr:four helix bundle protein [Bacteroidota bacterium]
MFDFQKLNVYTKSIQFHIDCKILMAGLKNEKHVADQLSRASQSIPLNIAEGSGKFSKPDRKNYFKTARASLFECISILEILDAEGKIEKQVCDKQIAIGDEISRMLFTMIRNLQV